MSAVPKSLLLVCFFVTATLVHAQPTTKQAKIDRILDLSNLQSAATLMSDQVRNMIGSQIKAQMLNATPEQLAVVQNFEDKLMTLVTTRLDSAKLRQELARTYDQLFTEAEINGLLVFFESPVGRSYLAKTGQLGQKTMEITQAQMSDLAPEIQRLSREMAAELAQASQKKQ
jgi:hypothetical protein